MGIILLFLAPIIGVIGAYIITKPIVKYANKKRLEKEAREEYEKIKLIERMINEETNENDHE